MDFAQLAKSAARARLKFRDLEALAQTTSNLEISTAGSLQDRFLAAVRHPPSRTTIYLLFWAGSRTPRVPPVRVFEATEDNPISETKLTQMWDSWTYVSIVEGFESRGEAEGE